MKKQIRIPKYDPTKVRKPRSPAQQEAWRRTWRIMQLRSLWVLSAWISEPGRAAVRAIIDHDLLTLGAEPHSDRIEREQREAEDQYQPIPF